MCDPYQPNTMPILIIQPPPAGYPAELKLSAAVGPFVPVEEQLPRWPNARDIIPALVPRHLRVEPRDRESLRFDTQWVRELFAATPECEKPTVGAMVNAAGVALAEYCEPVVRDVVGRRLCQSLVAEIDALFTEADYWNIAAGRPAARDYILHYLGIAPIHTPPDEETHQSHTQEVR